jgi:transcriptional regulator with XRE-family HTH domain
MNIGEAIKKIRASRGLSQKELAEKTGMSANALCNIEKGYSFPSKGTIKAICDAMDITVSWLLFSSITEEDVPEEKRAIFNALREPMITLFKKMEDQ